MSEFLLASADQSELARVIRAAIGVSPDEPVCVTTPMFNRPAAWEPAMVPPADAKTWAGFTHADRDTLRTWGLRPWGLVTTTPPTALDRISKRDTWFHETDDEATATHEIWLFPAEWYDRIPEGFPVVDIFGCLETFQRGTTDDRRFGMLSFGVVVPMKAEVTNV